MVAHHGTEGEAAWAVFIMHACEMTQVSTLLDLASSKIGPWWEHLAPYRALQLNILVLSIACLRRL